MTKITKADWVWMPHPAHLIVAQDCRFHLATYLPNGYIVSTVGEYWPDRQVRQIHAEVFDLTWHLANKDRKGDDYDHAYMEHFGYESLGFDRIYESMVFKGKVAGEGCPACPYVIESGSNLDFAGFNDAGEAYKGHLELCDAWAAREPASEYREPEI
jgi:hypothetical protein